MIDVLLLIAKYLGNAVLIFILSLMLGIVIKTKKTDKSHMLPFVIVATICFLAIFLRNLLNK